MLVIEIYDEMIILNIKVSKCNKDRDNDNNYESNNVINSSKLINWGL